MSEQVRPCGKGILRFAGDRLRIVARLGEQSHGLVGVHIVQAVDLHVVEQRDLAELGAAP